MREAEFDKFADEYLATHARNLAITGEHPDYFARHKIEEARRALKRIGRGEPQTILDFGSGIGASLPHLLQAFPSAAITAFDVSKRSLDIARARFPDCASFVHGETLQVLPPRSFDFAFAACVFHHIDSELHLGLFKQLRALLRSEGVLMIFEHNPLNPITQYIVATCPFDENAVLIRSGRLAGLQKQAGFSRVTSRFTGFFPNVLKSLRPLEPHLSALPIGAQYYTLAHA